MFLTRASCGGKAAANPDLPKQTPLIKRRVNVAYKLAGLCVAAAEVADGNPVRRARPVVREN